MAKPNVYPVILCGGSGTRLWPVSRKAYPKQFVPLLDDVSLFQMTLSRLTKGFAAPLLLTGNNFRFMVAEQTLQVGISGATILIEPEGRNTAPAILAAAQIIAENDPDGIMLVLSSDQLHRNEAAFLAAVEEAVISAQTGAMVTFGIKPTRPETGFGYIELESAIDARAGARDFLRFVEKPDSETAKEMVSSGRYLWNSGSFCFSVKSAISAFEEHAPDLLPAVRKSVLDRQEDLDFVRLSDAFKESPDISVDFAIMEKVTSGKVVPLDSGWND